MYAGSPFTFNEFKHYRILVCVCVCVCSGCQSIASRFMCASNISFNSVFSPIWEWMMGGDCVDVCLFVFPFRRWIQQYLSPFILCISNRFEHICSLFLSPVFFTSPNTKHKNRGFCFSFFASSHSQIMLVSIQTNRDAVNSYLFGVINILEYKASYHISGYLMLLLSLCIYRQFSGTTSESFSCKKICTNFQDRLFPYIRALIQ